MSLLITIDEFISYSKKEIIIDVRSESEFNQGHFPGAVNIPILVDEHRKEVGTIYKKNGRQEAVIKGFELAGPSLGEFIRKVKNLSPKNNPDSVVFVYCWRGGMRSAIADWLLSLAGFKVLRLKGGYKSFRNRALEILKLEKKILVLGGMTGSGKTEILSHLEKQGEFVIDLENLAHHKGSAFGGLGQLAQPTNEQFENLIAIKWEKIPNQAPLEFSDPGLLGPNNTPEFAWIENESRTIGHNQLPNSVYEQIRNAPVVEIIIPKEVRIKRILFEYGHFPPEVLAELSQKLKKRMGGQHLKEALNYLLENDLQKWAEKMLEYYDKSYQFGMRQRKTESVKGLSLSGKDYSELAAIVKEAGLKIMKKKPENHFSL